MNKIYLIKDSIERAKAFPEVKIYQITGQCNAAIARNIGAKESSGDVLFFIDGDMEIIPDFFQIVYKNNDLIHGFVSGQFENNYYDVKGNFLYKEDYYSTNIDQYQITTGGLFIIKVDLWNAVNGMNTKYTRSQDIDLGLRLSEKGIKLLRKKELMAKHHTISYNDSIRMWSTLLNCGEFYRVVLLRDHIVNWQFHKKFLRENYTSVFLLIAFIMVFLFEEPMVFLPYFAFIFIRAFINLRKEILRIPSKFFYFIARDVLIWFALFLFWPQKVEKEKYKKL